MNYIRQARCEDASDGDDCCVARVCERSSFYMSNEIVDELVAERNIVLIKILNVPKLSGDEEVDIATFSDVGSFVRLCFCGLRNGRAGVR